jgi:hypothetical protein
MEIQVVLNLCFCLLNSCILFSKVTKFTRSKLRFIVEYGGPGKKSPDYRASDPEGTLKHRIKIAHTR